MKTAICLALFTSMSATSRADAPKYPNTSAGKMAREFIEAFNSGDADQVRRVAEDSRTKSALESRTMDDRLQQYQQLYQSWGRLAVSSYEEHDDGSLTVLVKPDRGFDGLNLTFAFENANGKIDEIRIRPTMIADDSSEELGGGADGEVTILSGSLAPLREHFNANKDKHRVIAILSPT